MNGLTMKKMFSFFTISVMAISMRAAGNDIAAKLFDQSSGFRLHEGKVRKQKLIFIPEIPGADTGSWRIVWEKGEKILELILKHPIKLPPFESKIRIEMEIECSPGATLLAADLRLQDAEGEVCMFNSNRGGRYTGNITAIWEIAATGQKVGVSWGRNINKKLDFPVSITNFAFLLQQPKGDITIKSLRLITDPQEVQAEKVTP